MITRAIQALTVLSTVALSAGALGAEPVADFYRGKAVTLVVSSAPAAATTPSRAPPGSVSNPSGTDCSDNFLIWVRASSAFGYPDLSN